MLFFSLRWHRIPRTLHEWPPPVAMHDHEDGGASRVDEEERVVDQRLVTGCAVILLRLTVDGVRHGHPKLNVGEHRDCNPRLAIIRYRVEPNHVLVSARVRDPESARRIRQLRFRKSLRPSPSPGILIQPAARDLVPTVDEAHGKGIFCTGTRIR